MTQTNAPPKRLTIQIRIEPGCLGPDGKAHIDTFCAAATHGADAHHLAGAQRRRAGPAGGALSEEPL